MTPHEREELTVTLGRLWPRKFHPEELADWCDRLDAYHVRDVATALNEFKNTKKFAPKVSEILAVLKGKERPDAEKPERREDLATVVRRQRPDLADRTDFEVLLRYWRGDWHRYKSDADKRRKQIPTGKSGDAMRAEHDAREKAYRARVTCGCVNSLCVAGMQLEHAERWAAVVYENPDYFRQCLGELRGDPVDVFA